MLSIVNVAIDILLSEMLLRFTFLDIKYEGNSPYRLDDNGAV